MHSNITYFLNITSKKILSLTYSPLKHLSGKFWIFITTPFHCCCIQKIYLTFVSSLLILFYRNVAYQTSSLVAPSSLQWANTSELVLNTHGYDVSNRDGVKEKERMSTAVLQWVNEKQNWKMFVSIVETSSHSKVVVWSCPNRENLAVTQKGNSTRTPF